MRVRWATEACLTGSTRERVSTCRITNNRRHWRRPKATRLLLRRRWGQWDRLMWSALAGEVATLIVSGGTTTIKRRWLLLWLLLTNLRWGLLLQVVELRNWRCRRAVLAAARLHRRWWWLLLWWLLLATRITTTAPIGRRNNHLFVDTRMDGGWGRVVASRSIIATTRIGWLLLMGLLLELAELIVLIGRWSACA